MAVLGAISIVTFAEYIIGNPIVSGPTLKAVSTLGGLERWIVASAAFGWLAYRFEAFRLPFYAMTSVTAFTIVTKVSAALEIPLISILTAAWMAPSLGAITARTMGWDNSAPSAFLFGVAAQVAAIATLAMMGMDTWALAALAFHGFMVVSAMAYVSGWLEDQDRVTAIGAYSDFFYATFVLLVCLSIFVCLLLPVIYMLGSDRDGTFASSE